LVWCLMPIIIPLALVAMLIEGGVPMT
jgi:hypothetical protein